MKPALGIAGSIPTLTVLATCADAGDEPGAADKQTGPADTAAAPVARAQDPAPDTTEEALWAHLEAEAYRDNWGLWPGKDRLYAGTEPHGMLLTTYANNTAYRALEAGQGADLPFGRAPMCQACHQSAETGYIHTAVQR